MIFAEATPDAQSFLQFWLAISLISSVGAAVVGIAAFFNARRSQKREISFSREFATQDELLHVVKDLQRVEGEIEKVRTEMKQDRQVIMAAADARHEKTWERFDRLMDSVTRLSDRISTSRAK